MRGPLTRALRNSQTIHVERDRGEPAHPFDGVAAAPAFMDGSELCSQADPDLFFAEKNDTGFTHAAKAICRTCPLQADCLEWALVTNEAFGVWGGLSPRERQRLRKGAA